MRLGGSAVSAIGRTGSPPSAGWIHRSQRRFARAGLPITVEPAATSRVTTAPAATMASSPIEIGDGAQIGPAVQIYAADHPRDPAERRAGVEFGRPVRVGRNVWIGGGAIILPGV